MCCTTGMQQSIPEHVDAVRMDKLSKSCKFCVIGPGQHCAYDPHHAGGLAWRQASQHGLLPIGTGVNGTARVRMCSAASSWFLQDARLHKLHRHCCVQALPGGAVHMHQGLRREGCFQSRCHDIPRDHESADACIQQHGLHRVHITVLLVARHFAGWLG